MLINAQIMLIFFAEPPYFCLRIKDSSIKPSNYNLNNFELMKKILIKTNQLTKKEIMTKSRLLYNLYKNDKLPKNVKERCCNFILLEEKCKDYNKIFS